MEWLAALLCALLPEEPRRELARRYGIDPAPWSALLGVVEALGGGAGLVDSFLRRIRGLVDESTQAYLDHPAARAALDHTSDKLAFYWSGIWAWALWAVSPLTMLLYALVAIGTVRLVAYGVSGEPIAEPVVAIGWRIWRAVDGARRRGGHLARFGAERPDLVLAQPDGDLLVLTAQPRADWNERIAIQVGDRFFRLAEVGERMERGKRWHCHRLREESSSEVLRGLVRYDPPGAGGSGALPG